MAVNRIDERGGGSGKYSPLGKKFPVASKPAPRRGAGGSFKRSVPGQGGTGIGVMRVAPATQPRQSSAGKGVFKNNVRTPGNYTPRGKSQTASIRTPAPSKPTRSQVRATQPRITSTSTGQISRTAAPAAVAAPNTAAETPVAAPAAPPPPPSINDFLASDDAYKLQNTAIDQALADYLAQMGQQKSQYDGQYNDQMRDLGQTRTQSLGDLTNDFAGRGLLVSGLYDQADQDMRRDFSNRESDMSRARGDFMANLETGHTNFGREQELVRQNARREALARRAAKYNL